MGSGEFKAQGGVGAFLDDFDFDATCQVAGFELVYVPKRQDAIPSQNRGPRYNDASRRLVNRLSQVISTTLRTFGPSVLEILLLVRLTVWSSQFSNI